MLRSLIKTGLAVGLHATKGDQLLERLHTRAGGFLRMPVILGYHRVVENFPADSRHTIPAQCVSVKMLEQQLDWIGRRFRFAALDDLGPDQDRRAPGSRRVAAITFDDGYQDFYELAFPLLKRKGIPAAVFVVTDLVGTTQLQIHDRLYLLLTRADRKLLTDVHLMRRFSGRNALTRAAAIRDPQAAMEMLLRSLPQADLLHLLEILESRVEIADQQRRSHQTLSWDALQKLQSAGITIGSHTRSHALLTNEESEKMDEETAGSRRLLQQRLRCPIRHFAYPCGYFNPAAVAAVARAGYQFGYTICRHRDSTHPWLTIPRTLLWEKASLNSLGSFSPSIMSCQVHGSFDAVGDVVSNVVGKLSGDRLGGCRINHSTEVAA